MKMGIRMLAIAILVAGVMPGCMSPAREKQKRLAEAHFAPYEGPQRDWPTVKPGAASIQATTYGMAICHSLPDKPYQIVGSAQVSRRNAIKRVIRAAQFTGADAILLARDPSFTEAGIQVQPEITFREGGSGRADFVRCLLIRWKP